MLPELGRLEPWWPNVADQLGPVLDGSEVREAEVEGLVLLLVTLCDNIHDVLVEVEEAGLPAGDCCLEGAEVKLAEGPLAEELKHGDV
jgi:hypothetical protein